jgi:hypothetical protein
VRAKWRRIPILDVIEAGVGYERCANPGRTHTGQRRDDSGLDLDQAVSNPPAAMLDRGCDRTFLDRRIDSMRNPAHDLVRIPNPTAAPIEDVVAVIDALQLLVCMGDSERIGHRKTELAARPRQVNQRMKQVEQNGLGAW